MNFITVDAEFRRQWDDDASLDRYLHAINLSIYQFKIAFYARNGNAAQFDKVFAPKQIFMLPTNWRANDTDANRAPAQTPEVSGE